ncbi:MAG: UDP-N-acetylglucosamine 2-epimerase (non-hydrolyzing) [Desulfuromusa sp.]|nr:UDP-N-acetylglucosamine 2-epimerase (non-hydrolyzing) [Desulfuromusa sp.]
MEGKQHDDLPTNFLKLLHAHDFQRDIKGNIVKLAFVFGTRPELLKLIPIIKVLESRSPGTVVLFDTQQQRELTPDILLEYGVEHVSRIQFESDRSSLASQLASQLGKLDQLIVDCAGIVVQGDTISAVSGALVGFYHEMPVVHVEAGLRSHDDAQPFPEEMNRRLISNIASLHLAPTTKERFHLVNIGITETNIHVTGNPLADLCRRVKRKTKSQWDVLITMHRRENRSSGIKELCISLAELTKQHSADRFGIVRHSHPEVHSQFLRHLPVSSNLDYISPMSHQNFLEALLGSHLVMTDSGGVQEEAAMLGIPTMILRDVLDRQDGVAAGTARKVAVQRAEIVRMAGQVLKDRPQFHQNLALPKERPSELIADLILDHFSLQQDSAA